MKLLNPDARKRFFPREQRQRQVWCENSGGHDWRTPVDDARQCVHVCARCAETITHRRGIVDPL